MREGQSSPCKGENLHMTFTKVTDCTNIGHAKSIPHISSASTLPSWGQEKKAGARKPQIAEIGQCLG